MKKRKYKEKGESQGHRWVAYDELPWDICKVCGVVRRRDNNNSQCKGPVKVKPRRKRK